VRALELTRSWPVETVAAAVVRNGELVDAIGDLDRSFRLASITKAMFAWSVLVAAEEGTVDLDATLPHEGHLAHIGQLPCTLRHLLAHAGGYSFAGVVPIAAPGRRRIYSNTGIERAGSILAERSGLDVATYVREALLDPLGMASSELRGSPAHGMHSTVRDVVRFVGEVQRPRLVSAATAADALAIQFPGLAGIVPGIGTFDPCPWALGFEVHGSKSPHWMGTTNAPPTVGHFGGAGTMFWVDPRLGCALVALTNRPFDEWADHAVVCWRDLSDAVVAEVVRG
jgi:CubicO group peptidase (beta-lactamase class C family)